MTIEEYFVYKDGQVLWKKQKGSRGQPGKQFGCSEPNGYRHGMFNKKMYREHQLVFYLHHGYIPENIDHIDGNKSNNKIENLRECSKSENLQNTSVKSHSQTGLKNVIFDTSRNSYRVEIRANGKKHFLGRFKDLDLAALVAAEARNKFHGKYAKH